GLRAMGRWLENNQREQQRGCRRCRPPTIGNNWRVAGARGFSTGDASGEQWVARNLSTPSQATSCAHIKIFDDNLEKFSYSQRCCELTSRVCFRQRARRNGFMGYWGNK